MSSCSLGRKRWTSWAKKFGRSSKKASRGGAHRGDGRMAVIWRGPMIYSDGEQSNGDGGGLGGHRCTWDSRELAGRKKE
jgi:hypothetical protein